MICLFVCFFMLKLCNTVTIHNYSHANKAYVVVVVVITEFLRSFRGETNSGVAKCRLFSKVIPFPLKK